MNANKPISQVVLVLADGASLGLLKGLAERGRLPALSRLAALSRGGAIGSAVSVFPSTTGPAHLPFLTGCFPGPCNIPGIRWFDPARYAAEFWSTQRFRSYMGPGNLFASRDLCPGVRTVFQLVRNHASIGGHVRRGLRRSRNLTRWSRVALSVASHLTESRARSDAISAARLIEAVRQRVAFVFAVFYGIDAAAHKWGGGQQADLACERIDRAIERLLHLLEAQKRAAETLVLFVSDHGYSPTSAHLDLQGVVERVIGRTLAHPTIWRGLVDARAAVMVSGNAMAHVYLRADHWTAPKLLDAHCPELERLAAVLLKEPAVDQLIGAGTNGDAVVLSRRGRARIRRVGHAIAYEPDPGGDPFGYPASLAGTRDERAWLADTWCTDYPDAPMQVSQILQSPRAGHLIVTARPGYDLRARFEKPPHRGSHGSLHRLHLMTPLVASHRLVDGPVRTVDILPTALDALGIRLPAGINGRSHWPDEHPGGR